MHEGERKQWWAKVHKPVQAPWQSWLLTCHPPQRQEIGTFRSLHGVELPTESGAFLKRATCIQEPMPWGLAAQGWVAGPDMGLSEEVKRILSGALFR